MSAGSTREAKSTVAVGSFSPARADWAWPTKTAAASELPGPASNFGRLGADPGYSSLTREGRFAVAEPRGLDGSAALAGSTRPSSSWMQRRYPSISQGFREHIELMT